MKEIIEVLKKSDLFRNFREQEIQELLNCLKYEIQKYGKDDIVLLSGDTINSIGIVVEGNLQISKDDAFGNSIILSKIESSEMFAEAIACSSTCKSPVTVAAKSNATVIYLSYNKIANVCSKVCSFHTKLTSNLIKIVANKNLLLNFKIELLSAKTMREKLNIYFSRQVELKGSTCFQIPFSRSELADFLNVNRSALSRELSNMQKEKLLKFNKNTFEIFI